MGNHRRQSQESRFELRLRTAIDSDGEDDIDSRPSSNPGKAFHFHADEELTTAEARFRFTRISVQPPFAVGRAWIAPHQVRGAALVWTQASASCPSSD